MALHGGCGGDHRRRRAGCLLLRNRPRRGCRGARGFRREKALADHIEEERAAHKEYRAEQREDMRRLERKTDAMLLRWNIPNPAPVP